MSEMWKPIPGAEGFYSVSSWGRVRSEPQQDIRVGRQYGRLLSQGRDTKGYPIFRMCLPEKKRTTKVHSVVALAFIGPRPDGMQVNHKDGNKLNNHAENLEYVSCKRNIEHSWETGLSTPRQGETHNRSKLTDAIVREIRKRYPGESLQKIAEAFSVTKQCVWHIVHRKTWTHLD